MGRDGRRFAKELHGQELLPPAKQQSCLRLRRLYVGGSYLFKQQAERTGKKGILGLRRKRQRRNLDAVACKRRNDGEIHRLHPHGGQPIQLQGQKGHKNRIRACALRQQPPRPAQIRKHNGGRTVQGAGQNGNEQLSGGELCAQSRHGDGLHDYIRGG